MNIDYKNLLNTLLCTLFFSLLFLTGCNTSSQIPATNTAPLKETRFIFGTTVTLTLYDAPRENLLNEAFDLLTDLENTLSVNKAHTLIDTINESAGLHPVQVDSATFEVIQSALSYSHFTKGSFDLTIGPLVKLWNIGFPEARVPSQEEIQHILPLIDYQNVILDQEAQTVYLQKAGMQLDLGGIAKGYAADQIAEHFRTSGVQHAIINLGGNVYVLGNKPDDTPWSVGIQDPFNPRGYTIGKLQAIDQSIVTSGIYERYLEDEDGTHYHHILNPQTGSPYDTDIAGVTIISSTSTDGDALSTAAFALGIQKGVTFIDGIPGVEAIFISTDSKVYITSGLKDIFTLTSDQFALSQ